MTHDALTDGPPPIARNTSFQLDGEGPQAYERYLVPTFFAPCADQLLELAAVQPGERVLDLACGTGIVARRAAAAVGTTGAVVGVDVNEGMLARAAAMADAPDTVTWRSADAGALPLPRGGFDVVCCQQGLQFFTDQPRALHEMYRVLAPSGRVALAVWRSLEHHPVFTVLVEALEEHVGAEAADMMRSPFMGPGRDDLRRLLTEAGFSAPVLRIGVFTVRFPSPREFLRQEVVSSPLAGPVGALDASRRDALLAQVDRALAPYTDDDGVVFPMETWFAMTWR
jgi:ubiquinone/menaquinone biosynthesis C-methylase UbiE